MWLVFAELILRGALITKGEWRIGLCSKMDWMLLEAEWSPPTLGNLVPSHHRHRPTHCTIESSPITAYFPLSVRQFLSWDYKSYNHLSISNCIQNENSKYEEENQKNHYLVRNAVLVNCRLRVDEWNGMGRSEVRELFNDYDLYIKIKSWAQINL